MRNLIIALIAVPLCIFVTPGSAAAQADSMTMSASVNGHDVSSASVEHPLALDPAKPADITVELTNGSDKPVTVHRLVLRGTVLGLAFFSYDSAVDFTVAPASTGVLTYRLELGDLKAQATGLYTADIAAVDGAGRPIATVGTVADVRGSLISVCGLFGLALIALTGLALLDVALAVRRRTLPNNRWRRGLRLLAPGVGIGLIMAFTVSVLRIWLPSTEQWLLIAGVTAATFFTLGYLAPTTGVAEEPEPIDGFDTDDIDIQTVTVLESLAAQGTST